MKSMNRKLVSIVVKQSATSSKFLQSLRNENIPLYGVRFKEEKISFQVAYHHLSVVRQARRKYRVKLTIDYVSPNRILQRDMVTFIGMLLLIALPIFFTQYIWKVEIEASTIEIEDEVAQFLENELAIEMPMRRQSFIEDNELRQRIMEKFRMFSWIHITKQGSYITISPQLAPKLEEKEQKLKEQHLIASNSGVITHFQISRGIRKVEPNMTVYEGDTLVSGVLMHGEEYVIVGAEGEVFADYWLETTFSIPKKVEMEVLVDYGWEYGFNWGQLKEVWVTKSFEPIKTLISKSTYRMFDKKTESISEEDIDSIILPLLHEKMIRSLPLKSTIKSEKLLHVYTDDDTVKGTVLFLVNENIAKPHPIHQGE
jgi:similar to stage IV sporulation protein